MRVNGFFSNNIVDDMPNIPQNIRIQRAAGGCDRLAQTVGGLASAGACGALSAVASEFPGASGLHMVAHGALPQAAAASAFGCATAVLPTAIAAAGAGLAGAAAGAGCSLGFGDDDENIRATAQQVGIGAAGTTAVASMATLPAIIAEKVAPAAFTAGTTTIVGKLLGSGLLAAALPVGGAVACGLGGIAIGGAVRGGVACAPVMRDAADDCLENAQNCWQSMQESCNAPQAQVMNERNIEGDNNNHGSGDIEAQRPHTTEESRHERQESSSEEEEKAGEEDEGTFVTFARNVGMMIFAPAVNTDTGADANPNPPI